MSFTNMSLANLVKVINNQEKVQTMDEKQEHYENMKSTNIETKNNIKQHVQKLLKK